MDDEKTARNAAIIKLYDGGKGMTINDLSRMFNVSATTIRQQLDKVGARVTKRPDSAGQHNPRRWRDSTDKFQTPGN